LSQLRADLVTTVFGGFCSSDRNGKQVCPDHCASNERKTTACDNPMEGVHRRSGCGDLA
jgi:hypothetical protein